MLPQLGESIVHLPPSISLTEELSASLWHSVASFVLLFGTCFSGGIWHILRPFLFAWSVALLFPLFSWQQEFEENKGRGKSWHCHGMDAFLGGC
jgi:hypothetical protein